MARMIASMSSTLEPSAKWTALPCTSAMSALIWIEPVNMRCGNSSFMIGALLSGFSSTPKPKLTELNLFSSFCRSIWLANFFGIRSKNLVRNVASRGAPPSTKRDITHDPLRVLKYTCCVWWLRSQAISPEAKKGIVSPSFNQPIGQSGLWTSHCLSVGIRLLNPQVD